LLNEARDAHALFGKHLAHRGEYSRPILGANSVVGAGDDLAHRDHTDPVVEAEGGPALDAATDRAREIDQVPDHGRRGRTAAGTLTHQQHLADQVAFDEHRVVRALDSSQRVLERHHRRVDARFDAPGMALRVRNQLDRVPKLARVAKVDRLDALDAFAIDLVRSDPDLI